MSQNNPSILYAGLDVAKASLELHLADPSHPLSNDPKGHAQMLKLLRAHPGVQVICEASGGYERAPVRALHQAALPLSVVEAGRVRYFARAKGQRAKTDPIDARVLTEYGAALRPAATPAPTAQQERLEALDTRRRQLLETLVAERNRSAHYTEQLCVRQAAALIKALAGVAPYNQDSGGHAGARHIAGGRRAVRCALYLSALSAVKHDAILKAFYLKLRAAGKQPKVALVACLRKLVVLMNRLLKNPQLELAK